MHKFPAHFLMQKLSQDSISGERIWRFTGLGNVFGVVLELVMLWSEMAIISKQSNPPFVA